MAQPLAQERSAFPIRAGSWWFVSRAAIGIDARFVAFALPR